MGVVNAVEADNLGVQSCEASCDVCLVEAEGAERSGIAQLEALDERRRENTRCTKLSNRLGEDHALVARKVFPYAFDVVTLEAEVELLRQDLFAFKIVGIRPLTRHNPSHDPH